MDNYFFKNDIFKYDSKLTEADLKSVENLYNYQSPIEMIATEMQTKYEDDCVSVCQSYGFNVDKEELKKALEYDRDQYNKGYEAGYTAALSEYLELRSAILKLLKVEGDANDA